MLFSRPAAILFDLDGTLMDDNRAVEAGVNSVHSAYGDTLGMSFPDLAVRWRELLNEHYARYLAGEISMQEQRRQRVMGLFGHSNIGISPEAADEVFALYEGSYRGSWAAFADVVPTLSALNGCTLAVLTNGEISQQTEKLGAAGLAGYFCNLFASSEIGFAKPSAKAFLHACGRLQLDPQRCAYVGDELDTDAYGSASAGLMSVWLNRRKSKHTPSSEIRVIHTLSELPALIEHWERRARTPSADLDPA
jgi:putative hydrolase of the HAD superfamily